MVECSVKECTKPRAKREWCERHYQRWRKHGDPLGGRPDAPGCSVDGCNGKHYVHGMCCKHFGRWKRHGDPLAGRLNAAQLRAALEVAARSDGAGCVYLPGRSGTSRPVVVLDGQGMTASRAVWIIRYGDPGEAFVLHRCGRGVQGCIGIDCLYLGDHAQNMRDRVADGNYPRGERNNLAKLTESDVLAIRDSYTGVRGQIPALARQYNVTAENIRCIVKRQTWTHI